MRSSESDLIVNISLIIIMIYDTRCVMGLNRGFMGLKPCPVCNVGKDELHDCGKSWPLRSGPETQEIIEKSRKLNSTQAEDLLKVHGLRAIDVRQFYTLFDQQNLMQILECIPERSAF